MPTKKKKAWRPAGIRTWVLTATATLSACMVGPNDVRPPADAPAAFKETQGWKNAQPRDAAIRGSWWEVFGDAQLNALEAQVDVSNQTLKAAEARARLAHACFRGLERLIADVDLRFERVELCVAEDFPPASPDRRVAWLRVFPALRLLECGRRIGGWAHVI